MKTEIKKILQMKNFFNIVNETGNNMTSTLKEPSKILMQNIYINWLQFLYSKTHKSVSVSLNKPTDITKHNQAPYGFIISDTSYNKNIPFQLNLNEYLPKNNSKLQFNLIVPQQEAMQHFIQWQRHRKYWWSSITTTPSLFGINEISFGDRTADVNVVAQLPQCKEEVETITLFEKGAADISHIKCTMSLENALFILLLDGLNNNTREKYLRLHRKMAPYKISFALTCEDSKIKETLRELVVVLQHKLKLKRISTWLPNFSTSLESQIGENLQLGVTYTAVLNENTLTNGIFSLMNSSTMLKEQVHIADFDTYAELLCNK